MQPAPISDAVRRQIIRKLGFIFASSVVLQAAAFLVCAALLRLGVATFGGRSEAVAYGALALRELIAVPLGYLGARLTWKAMRGTVPIYMRVSRAPVVVGAIAALTVIIGAHLIEYTISDRASSVDAATSFGLDIVAAALWMLAVWRALHVKR